MDHTLLLTEEVADILRVPVETLRAWRKAGKGPHSFRLPGARRVLYDRQDVQQFISEGRVEGVGA